MQRSSGRSSSGPHPTRPQLAAVLAVALLSACSSAATPTPQPVMVEPAGPEGNDEPEPREPIVPPSAPPPAALGWCLRSRMCDLEGMCTPAQGDLCIAAADSDCEGSKACLGGRCSARNGVCVAANDEDCRESWACKGYGRCAFDGEEACMATAEADCQASTRCQREGECKLGDGVCIK